MQHPSFSKPRRTPAEDGSKVWGPGNGTPSMPCPALLPYVLAQQPQQPIDFKLAGAQLVVAQWLTVLSIGQIILAFPITWVWAQMCHCTRASRAKLLYTMCLTV